MRGICGQYNFGHRAPVLPQDVQRITQTISHSGPDDDKYFVAGRLGLGFCRLAMPGSVKSRLKRLRSAWLERERGREASTCPE